MSHDISSCLLIEAIIRIIADVQDISPQAVNYMRLFVIDMAWPTLILEFYSNHRALCISFVCNNSLTAKIKNLAESLLRVINPQVRD